MLDTLAGDPHWMPHPVRLMGSAISCGEFCFFGPGPPVSEFLRGAVLTGAIVAGSWFAARAGARVGGACGEVLLACTTLAARSLRDESETVLTALDKGDMVLARKRLSMIVGRDTESLDASGISRAVIETVAESLCDGVVAPVFYLTLGGISLALAYKAVNTLDSMIGHREYPYLYFGRAAARLDDLANFIPATLNGSRHCGERACGEW
jgi:adenosylcobinamide-phosphate synthase